MPSSRLPLRALAVPVADQSCHGKLPSMVNSCQEAAVPLLQLLPRCSVSSSSSAGGTTYHHCTACSDHPTNCTALTVERTAGHRLFVAASSRRRSDIRPIMQKVVGLAKTATGLFMCSKKSHVGNGLRKSNVQAKWQKLALRNWGSKVALDFYRLLFVGRFLSTKTPISTVQPLFVESSRPWLP